MKLLDKYIIRKFLGTFFFSILLIVVISMIFDVTEKMDDIIEKEIPIRELVFDYYFNFIPYFANLFSPLFCFISVVFFTSKMANQTEIVAILASGVSFKRLLVPFILSAITICTLSFLLNSFVIPHANTGRLKFEYKYLKYNWNRNYSNLHRQIKPGQFIYLETFNEKTKTGFRFTLEEIQNQTLRSKISADYIRWDSTSGGWQLDNYVLRTFKGKKEFIVRANQKDTLLGFRPEEFALADDDVEMMDIFELNTFIDKEQEKGSNFVDYYKLERQRRMANPFSTIVLTLIAVPLAGRKVRGGVGLHIGIGIGISFAFILLNQVSSVFATEGGLEPEIAAWVPNMIFMVIAILLLRNAPK